MEVNQNTVNGVIKKGERLRNEALRDDAIWPAES
jgi:hypothetical protein